MSEVHWSNWSVDWATLVPTLISVLFVGYLIVLQWQQDRRIAKFMADLRAWQEGVQKALDRKQDKGR